MKTVFVQILSEIKNSKHYKFIPSTLLLMCAAIIVANSQVITVVSNAAGKTKTAVSPDQEDLLKTYIVTGIVTQTFSYCGGAAPPKHLLDKLAVPVAYAGKKFYIRPGKTNSVKIKTIKSFTTNDAGEFSFRLSPGIYAIILEEQLHKIKAGDYTKQDQSVDEKCLQQWWVKPYYVLEVKGKNINRLNFNFHHPCFISSDIPCITYNGPMPP